MNKYLFGAVAILFFVVITTFITIGGNNQRERERAVQQDTLISKERIVTKIPCMDARIQKAVDKWIKEHYGTDLIEPITAAGANRILARKSDILGQGNDLPIVTFLKYEINISIKHGVKVFVLAGHAHCGGNPGSKEEQIEDLLVARETIKSFDFKDKEGNPAKVVLLWVEESQGPMEGHWTKVERIE